jgi:hypothetical protein
MLIRGLPEMSIKDIYLSNVVIKSRRGVDLLQASDVSLSNMVLQCANSSPLINIENSQAFRLPRFARSRCLRSFMG